MSSVPVPSPADTLTCVDLDRTVIYSTNALALAGPDVEAPRLLCVEIYRQLPLSYVTERAAALLVQLAQQTTLVPVTTRTPEQFRRVHLPTPTAGSRPQFAITSNGGQILVDGQPDPLWSARVSAALSRCAPVRDMHHFLTTRSSDDFVQSIRIASDLFVYAVVERAKLPIGWIEELTEYATEHGWRVSLQGRKVYLVPIPLTKSAAVAELRRRTGARLVLAAGDSLLDQDLLEAADVAVRPASGELAESGWTRAHVHQIRQPGVVGGERLVEWLMSRVSESATSLRQNAPST